MAQLCMILGEPGTGKSTSIRNLDESKTFLINVLQKELPFRKWKSRYKPITKQNEKGNFYCSDNYVNIDNVLKIIAKRKDIETLVLDDFQYLMANEFMRRHSSAGKGSGVFQVYNEIADHAWNLIMNLQKCKENLTVFVLSHIDTDESGKSRCKTIGKMLNDKICLEGMFPIVLSTAIENGEYFFETQNSGDNTSKSPLEMFSEKRIQNDLEIVRKSITEYYN